MYVINQCLRCVSAVPSVTCGFFNRIAECCTRGEGERQVNQQIVDDSVMVQLENRIVSSSDVSLQTEKDKEESQHDLEKRSDESKSQKSDAGTEKSPVSNELSLNTEGDEGVRRRLKNAEDQSKSQKSISAQTLASKSEVLSETPQYFIGDPLIIRRIEKCKADKPRRGQEFTRKNRELESLLEANKCKQRISFVSLRQIKDAGGDIKKIRMLLQGSSAECLRLFKEAGEKDDVIAQIQLSWAIHFMDREDDRKKDFSKLGLNDLKDVNCYPKNVLLSCPFDKTWEIAFKQPHGFGVKNGKGAEAIKKAAERGYLPAILEHNHDKWQGCSNSYVFANQLAPHVGKGFEFLDYCFGRALKNGSFPGSEPFRAGIYWMECSLGIKVKFAKIESIEDNDDFAAYECSNYYCDGFVHMTNGDIFAPSKEFWLNYKEGLTKDKYGDPSAYIIPHNDGMNVVLSMMDDYEVNISCNDPSGEEKVSKTPLTVYLSQVDEDDERVSNEIGKITTLLDPFSIHVSMDDDSEMFQPLVHFITLSMERKVSANSVCLWIQRALKIREEEQLAK